MKTISLAILGSLIASILCLGCGGNRKDDQPMPEEQVLTQAEARKMTERTEAEAKKVIEEIQKNNL